MLSYSRCSKDRANQFKPVANQNVKSICNFSIQFLKPTYGPDCMIYIGSLYAKLAGLKLTACLWNGMLWSWYDDWWQNQNRGRQRAITTTVSPHSAPAAQYSDEMVINLLWLFMNLCGSTPTTNGQRDQLQAAFKNSISSQPVILAEGR